jgi:hypothetical protein
VSQRPRLEVADVLRAPEATTQIVRGSAAQKRVVRALTSCRTAVLGGHVDECDRCGRREISYNSCRNRHCPKCQGAATAEWLDAHRQHLLPVPYSHVVFTLPQELAPLALQNQRLLYGFLFQAASQALLELASDARHLGAQVGFLAILHTWGQTLLHHPHLHCLVPAGGIGPHQERWVSSRPTFFLPVRPLSRLFRGKYLALLEQAFRQRRIQFHGDLAALAEPNAFARSLASLRAHDWVVHAKPPFGGPEQVLKYLARYTHRVAISNGRLQRLGNGQVTFEWKDYAHGNQLRLMTLTAAEFTRRFLLHVLPDHFVRIRYYGFLANCRRETLLSLCRSLLGAPDTRPQERATEGDPDVDDAQDISMAHERRCQACRVGRMIMVETLRPDTS